MRLLVTGAGGQLGCDVARVVRRAGHEVAACTHAELDIGDDAAVEEALARARPDALVNCAAYTDVDRAESDQATAMAVNGEAPGRLANACAEAGALIVHVSSDYVFDGRSGEPYVESDRPNPLSAYGRSKLAGEQAVAAAGGRHAIVRSSWLFGVGGRNFVETMLSLGVDRDKVTVVTDQVGCPTWTAHLAEALVEIAQREALGLHHVAAAGESSWHDFAVAIFERAGVDCDVRGGTTAELGSPAARPAYSVLRSARSESPTLPHWREGLAGYLAARPAAAPDAAASVRPQA
jgi:dTDP-4-dehydrorhamnose reductase